MKKMIWIGGFFLWACLGVSVLPVQAVEPDVQPILEKVPTRPNPQLGPTEVAVGIWLIDIDSINSAQQNFVVNAFIVLQWKDPRLAHGGKDSKRYLTNDIWTPRAQIANEIGIVRKTMADFVDVTGDGTVTYRQRYVGPLSQAMKLHDFPFDKHMFRIHIISMSSAANDIRFIPKEDMIRKGMPEAAGISPDISLPDWIIENYHASTLPYVVNPQIQVPGYAFDFTAHRDSRYFVWKVIFPLILIVMMSWTAFWIDPKEIGTNVTAVMTSMLTLVAYRFTFENYIPKIGYLTRIDKFMLWSTVMIFGSMMQVAVNSRLVSQGRHKLAIQIDRWARVIYPIIFTFITVMSLVV